MGRWLVREDGRLVILGWFVAKMCYDGFRWLTL